MRLRTQALLLAALAAVPGWSQDFSLTSTTFAQVWKEDIPGFEKRNFVPFTQFLAIDATNLYRDEFSLHLFGWGRADLQDASLPEEKKNSGDLAYGYVTYRFKEGNAEVKAGRFTVNQGVAIEQVDGAAIRADLRGGFTFSAFGGRPVWYKTRDHVTQKDYEYQRDIIVGARLGLRIPKFGEIGVSYLMDGTEAAKDLDIPSDTDYTREQVGIDLRVAPHPAFDLTGRTTLDVASHTETPATKANKPSTVAENDWAATVRFAEGISLTGTWTERNFYAFFAGTNLPSLFRQDERDKFKAYGGRLAVAKGPFEVVASYRRTDRESYGDATRFGAELRWNLEKQKIQSGFGYHRVTASDATVLSSATPSYGLSHAQVRVWTMAERGKFLASLDAVFQRYDDEKNPYLAGRTNVYEIVGSLGYQATETLKLSGDLSVGANPLFKKDVRGLVRLEYRFASAKKGGGK